MHQHHHEQPSTSTHRVSLCPDRPTRISSLATLSNAGSRRRGAPVRAPRRSSLATCCLGHISPGDPIQGRVVTTEPPGPSSSNIFVGDVLSLTPEHRRPHRRPTRDDGASRAELLEYRRWQRLPLTHQHRRPRPRPIRDDGASRTELIGGRERGGGRGREGRREGEEEGGKGEGRTDE